MIRISTHSGDIRSQDLRQSRDEACTPEAFLSRHFPRCEPYCSSFPTVDNVVYNEERECNKKSVPAEQAWYLDFDGPEKCIKWEMRLPQI